MQLLDSSARLKNLGDDILDAGSAEMEEFLRVQETIYKLIKCVPGSQVIENIRGWLSHVRRHLRTKAKVFLTSGVLRELIDAHILITECFQGRDPEILQIALSRVKPKSRLKRAFACPKFADLYLKIFEEFCIEESIGGGGGSEDSDSGELQCYSIQETTPAPSPFGDSCYSDEDAQGHTAETASVDSGYASSGSLFGDSYHSDEEASGFESCVQELHVVDSRYVSPAMRDQAIQPPDGYSLMPSTEYADKGSAAGGMPGHQFTLPQATTHTSLLEPDDSTSLAGEFPELFGPPWFPSMNDDGVAPCDTYLT
ncbi:hypothetical protein EWM64_g7986 [Hericium alpestre]|uniref:Uncharacterized protein n=1 Tax=Hericium alpestre TaxID=135208 RepID=A0A4Y9ZN37_9AGAM|nr:hypothetical protein EWM64_g7986 [Hericium alpestre]